MSRFLGLTSIAVLVFTLSGCVTNPFSRVEGSVPEPVVHSTAGIYRGELPSASGPGRILTLDLRLNGFARFIEDYQREEPFIQDGTWVLDGDLVRSSFLSARLVWKIHPEELRLHLPENQDYGTDGIRLKRVSGPGIVNIQWEWIKTVTPKEVFHVDHPENYTFLVDGNGGLGARLGCNVAGGESLLEYYDPADPGRGSIDLGSIFSTLMYCDDQDIADRFSRELQAAALFFLRDGLLYMDLFADSGTMVFRPVPFR